MDSPCESRYPFSNVFFLLLLLSTNLVTFFFSNAFYSTSCTLNPELDTATTISTDVVNVDAAVISQPAPVQDESQTTSDLPSEFLAFTSSQKLPFGFNKNMDSDKIFPPVGAACTLFLNELRRYMSYEVNGSCPDDELLAQKLLLKGCEPLPRRRCRPAAPKEYAESYPLPDSLWTTPSDSSVVWTAYTCKNYTCLINRIRNQKGFDDCKDCFDLEGREKTRWTAAKTNTGNLDFSIDEVLATKKPGSIRIGLDIGGGVATFAVRMRQRNITIVTTSMNLNGPFNSFIASRGVIPLYISISQRLPFFDNTLDIIHSMHVLSNWIPTTLLHFLFFDIYRVLRPGGLFWLDHFFCVGEQLEQVYVPLIESIGFSKVKWVVGHKLDRGSELREMYLSAILEKPLKNSWEMCLKARSYMCKQADFMKKVSDGRWHLLCTLPNEKNDFLCSSYVYGCAERMDKGYHYQKVDPRLVRVAIYRCYSNIPTFTTRDKPSICLVSFKSSEHKSKKSVHASNMSDTSSIECQSFKSAKFQTHEYAREFATSIHRRLSGVVDCYMTE